MCPACLAVIKHPLLIGGSAVGVFIVFLTKRLQRALTSGASLFAAGSIRFVSC
jgi:hypothetical protein